MKKALAFSALPILFLFVAAFQSSNSVPAQLAAIQAELSELKAQVASSVPRKFYLTKTFHNGAGALSACAEGYQMANFWEIHDPSNLRYNTELGATLNDSGSGPPLLWGWIRTARASAVHNIPGVGNCLGWTSTFPGDYGTFVYFQGGWARPPNYVVDPWAAETASCDTTLQVWCVQD